MKHTLTSHLLYSLAAGFIIWSVYEFFLYLTDLALPGSNVIRYAVNGILFGLFIGTAVLCKDGYLADNLFKLKKGLVNGLVLGLLGGLFSFLLIEQLYQQFPQTSEMTAVRNAVLIVQWFMLAMFIGTGFGIREGHMNAMARGLISGAVAGLSGGMVMAVASQLSGHLFWSRGIGILVTVILFSLVYHTISFLKRKTWLRGLNGKLEGIDFELCKDIHYLGTQSNDDINLKSYTDIRPTHAKLVRYYAGYSLVDNDPFWQTFVNFRNVREQPLKNGDIIKIGKALFQYCSVDTTGPA